MNMRWMTSRRGGFSLIELLMAIFILGIGIISIASLFPAGISQQRAAVDGQVGPIVARNAMSLLRTRIPPGAFGYVEAVDGVSPWDIQAGDFPWLRPSVVIETDSGSGLGLGAIDIFDALDEYEEFANITTAGEKNFVGDYADPWLTDALSSAMGIPYSLNLENAPVVVIEQEERQYPREVRSGNSPRYYWDCMFRRAGGKVKVAIFVYRMQAVGEEGKTWQSSLTEDGLLQMPWMLDLESSGNQYQPWRVGQGAGAVSDRSQWVLDNADAGDDFDPMNLDDCWQCPGQWIIDQNGIIHMVSVGRSYVNDPRTRVELSSPVPSLQEDSLHVPEESNDAYGSSSDNRVDHTGSLILPASARFDPAFNYGNGMVTRDLDGGPDILTGGPVVSRLWYLPVEVADEQGTPWSVTPVYILIEEF